MMKKIVMLGVVLASVALLGGCDLIKDAIAQTNTVVAVDPDPPVVVPWFSGLLEPALIVLGTVLTAVFTWVSTAIKARTNIDIDQKYRDMLHAALMNGIRSFLAGRGWIAGQPVPVAQATAFAADYAKRTNPDAVAHFKLSDTSLQELAVTKLPDVNPATVSTPVPAAEVTASPGPSTI